jgi:hypothetical protein
MAMMGLGRLSRNMVSSDHIFEGTICKTQASLELIETLFAQVSS